MKKLKEYADLYISKGIWVYPSIIGKKYTIGYWNKLNDTKYIEEYKNYDWDNASSIRFITGVKGQLVFVTNKDELGVVLNLLDLPNDYKWLIAAGYKIGVLVFSTYDIKNLINNYDIETYSYNMGYVLPPGNIHSTIDFDRPQFMFGEPDNAPITLKDKDIDALFAFLRKRKEARSKKEETPQKDKIDVKKSMKVGCGCLTIVAMGAILAAMGVFDGKQFGFMETLLVLISMVALFALGAYITKDT